MKAVIIAAIALTLAASGLQVGAGRSEAAATSLFVSQRCSATPGMVQMTFSWTGNNPAALQQWFDLSLQNNGWVSGTYSAVGPLSPATQAVIWDGLSSNVVYFARVNQLLSNGAWDSSITWQISTLDCSGFTPVPATAVTRVVVIQPVARVFFVPVTMPYPYYPYHHHMGHSPSPAY